MNLKTAQHVTTPHPLALLVILSLSLLLSGCATILDQSADEVHFESEPQGADIYLRDQKIGTTPFTTSITRQTASVAIYVEKPGFQGKSVTLIRNIAPKAMFNLFFITTTFGSTSFGIDALSGKLFRYAPDSYVIALSKVTATKNPQDVLNHAQSSTALQSIDTERALEFVLTNERALRKEIAAKSAGQTFNGFCTVMGLATERCPDAFESIEKDRASILKTPHGLGLYRALRARLVHSQAI